MPKGTEQAVAVVGGVEPVAPLYSETDANTAIFLVVSGYQREDGVHSKDGCPVFAFYDPHGKVKAAAEAFKAGEAKMPPYEPFSEWFMGRVKARASQLDYSTYDDETLVSLWFDAADEVFSLGSAIDLFWGNPVVQEAVRESPEKYLDELLSLPSRMADPMTRSVAIADEIFARGSQNKTNLVFSRFRTAYLTGDTSGQEQALKELHEIGIRIPLAWIPTADVRPNKRSG